MKPLNAREGYWLTQKEVEDSGRIFTKSAIGVHATHNYWKECTNAEKEQWEAEHPQPEPDEN